MSPEDAEYVLNLPYHLKEAAKEEAAINGDLSGLLTDYEFLEYKIFSLPPQALIEDYELALQPDIQIPEDKKETLKLIQGAIRLSTKVLADDPKQLSGQLIGRLMHYTQDEEIKEPKSLYWIPNFLGYLAIGISIVIVSPILILLILLVFTQIYI